MLLKVVFIVPICSNKPVFRKIVIYCSTFCNNKLQWQNFMRSVQKKIYSAIRRCRNKPGFIATRDLHSFAQSEKFLGDPSSSPFVLQDINWKSSFIATLYEVFWEYGSTNNSWSELAEFDARVLRLVVRWYLVRCFAAWRGLIWIRGKKWHLDFVVLLRICWFIWRLNANH